MKKAKRIEVFAEFLVFGILIGTIEDIIAVKVVAGIPITLQTIGVIVMIAIPFAILGEVFADTIDFVELFRKVFRKRSGNH